MIRSQMREQDQPTLMRNAEPKRKTMLLVMNP